MDILLDTCTFLWMVDETNKLGVSIRSELEDSSNRVFLHQASCWEIQIKYDSGKLSLARPPEDIIPQGLKMHGVEYLRLQIEEIWHLRKLPPIHRDPFDRILISAALLGGLKFATPDPRISEYPVPVVW